MQIFKTRPGSYLTKRNLLLLPRLASCLTKRSLLLFLCTSLSTSLMADAGFSVSRKHAASIITFSGTDNLTTYKLVNAYREVPINDDETIYVQEGGRRWDESERDVKLLLVDTATKKVTDSLQLYAKDYSMHIKIAGAQNGKLQYSIDSTKAVYDYLLMDGDEKREHFKRNRILFITCSAAGFILLFLLFFFRKRKTETQNNN